MTSDSHLKTPFNLSMQAFAKGKVDETNWNRGKSWPCTVSRVISSGIVEINFEVNAGPTLTLPKIIVPISYPEYIRYPIQIGDKGRVVASDVRLGGITGLGSGLPVLSQPGNLTGLAFEWLGNVNWTPATDPNSVEIYGPNGVIMRDTGSKTVVTLTPDGITIDLGGDLTINANGNTVTVNDGDVIADGISLKTHTHSGVTEGDDDTGEPVS